MAGTIFYLGKRLACGGRQQIPTSCTPPDMFAITLATTAVVAAGPTDLSCLATSWPTGLRSLYPFTGGESGTSIGDGGRDMFDNGNILRVRVHGQWSEPLKYMQVCAGEASDPARGDVDYATCKTPGVAPVFAATFHSPSGAIDGFRVSGNVGTDGSGYHFANAGDTPLQSSNLTDNQYGFYKKTWGATDPSINHLIIVRGVQSAVTDIGQTTDSDLHMLTFPHGAYSLLYLMWAGTRCARRRQPLGATCAPRLCAPSARLALRVCAAPGVRRPAVPCAVVASAGLLACACSAPTSRHAPRRCPPLTTCARAGCAPSQRCRVRAILLPERSRLRRARMPRHARSDLGTAAAAAQELWRRLRQPVRPGHVRLVPGCAVR